MNYMEANNKNAKAVNEIIKTLENFTINEAYSILEFAKRRIEYTSKVTKAEPISFE